MPVEVEFTNGLRRVFLDADDYEPVGYGANAELSIQKDGKEFARIGAGTYRAVEILDAKSDDEKSTQGEVSP